MALDGRVSSRIAWVLAASLGAGWGCMRAAPPSQYPSARLALDRVRALHACSRGLRADAKLDYFDASGRVRVGAFLMAVHPRQVRFDLVSPFGTQLATLTSDGTSFALLDQKDKSFHTGPANQCAVERFLRVPIPPDALVQLLSGEAPILSHRPEDAQIGWEGGNYVVRIQSAHQATERIVLEPLEADLLRPYVEQRLRVREVTVSQAGVELYHAELRDYRAVNVAGPRKDPEGIEAEIPASGPACNAEVPHTIRFRVPLENRDVLLEQSHVEHNPPLIDGVFQQQQPPGTQLRTSTCQ
jgi:Outer membrane lipoprotein LolB